MRENQIDFKKLLYIESYEDFLQYTVKNLSQEKKQQAYLFYTDFNLKTNLAYLQNKKINRVLDLKETFFFNSSIKENHTNLNNVFTDSNQNLWSNLYSNLLKDLLKKPVLPLIVIPFFSQSCVLCVENFDNTFCKEDIQNYFFQYYTLFSSSLVQIQEQNKSNFFSFLWEQAFEKNMDPMSIENTAVTFKKKNEAFSKSSLEGVFKNNNCKTEEPLSYTEPKNPKNTEPKNRGSQNTEPKNTEPFYIGDSIYEPTYYDIKTGDNDLVKFCHYKDVSKILFLREDLLQRKKMAALGGLADQLSNQLNNPLAGIRALAQILQTSIPESSEMVSNLKDIEQDTWRCRSIIENLKNFSNKSSTSEIFELNKLVLDVVALSKIALSKSPYTLSLAKIDLKVRGSRQLIQQVIFNLIINAIQAISEGDKIILKSYQKSDQAILEIKDYGMGMSSQVREKIFTPFFTTKKNEGTGLGLSMSFNIMKKFSGSIEVESKEGEYTLFTLKFPITRE